MKNRQGFEEKSRLGRLLINRGYLSDGQLAEGLRLQRETGQRLGEVFVQSGWITERDLQRVLKHQTRYRHAAALVTMVVLPLQPMVSFASSSQTNESGQGAADAGQMVSEGRLKALTDQEMADVSGRGDDSLFDRFAQVGSMPAAAKDKGKPGTSAPDAIEALKLVTSVAVPVLNFLDSEVSISGVHYREGEAPVSITGDGGLELALPERIEQIRMENIRVGASPSMGNITISDVRFHAGSSMTIRAR